MQIGRETIVRGCNGIEQHYRTDLSPVPYAVSDHVHEHFLARHAARGTVRKREADPNQAFNN
jgi:hypothetical protein